jgi:hypothetical protein
MLQLTEKQILDKYQTLPPKIKEALESTSYFEKIENIGKWFDLSRDDVDVLETTVGYIFLGFLPPQNLFKETNDYLEAEEKIVVEVIREINRRVLFPSHEELEKLYRLSTHIEETVKIEEIKKIIPSAPPEKGEEKKVAPLPEIKIPPKSPEQKVEIKKGGPLILHEEKPIGEEKIKAPPKPFSFPFRVFAAKSKTEAPPPVRAKIEGFGGQPPAEKKKPTVFKKEPQKIVHYSELRTPLEPFGAPPESTKQEEVINLEIFQTTDNDHDKNHDNGGDDNKKQAPTSSPPKLEGNIVDLR